MQQEGRTVRLRVQRGPETLEKTLTLRRPPIGKDTRESETGPPARPSNPVRPASINTSYLKRDAPVRSRGVFAV
jgi:hypothetical protein